MCDKEVWVHLLQGVDDFSEEKVDELVRFGGAMGPDTFLPEIKMKAELLSAVASKMVGGSGKESTKTPFL